VAEVEHRRGYPVGVNDPDLTALVAGAARAVLGDRRVVALPDPSLGGEDFYAFGDTGLPVAMFTLGVADPAAGRAAPLHSPDFDLDEAALPAGVAVFGEAVRRAQEHQAGGLVVLASDGRPTGIVDERAVQATPSERRPWMDSGSLARTLEPGLLLSADLVGEALVRAMQRTPANEYVLVEPDGSVFGVLVSSDVDRAFAQ